MADYKCISCSNIKSSEKDCSCPVCGYKMFRMPYEKSAILKKEIVSFLDNLRIKKVKVSDLDCFRVENNVRINKVEDKDRFPSYNTINAYICAAKKTEKFCERVVECAKKLRDHFDESYYQNYNVSLSRITDEEEKLDKILKEALKELELNCIIEEEKIPDVSLRYSETPDKELVPLANDIIDRIIILSQKIGKFIKRNNIYGSAFKETFDLKYKHSKDKSYSDELLQCIDMLDSINNKRYVVDILSDGTEELNEMLKMLWTSFLTVMSVPILTQNNVYCFADSSTEHTDDFIEKLARRIAERYVGINNEIFACDFLSDKSDDELFALYNKMIELDTPGIMGVNKRSLIKIGESEKKLNEMIGLKGIKDSIAQIKAYAKANKENESLNIHMCFLGNPGSGKTEVARFLAGILYENKILPTKKLIEVDRSGLVSEYFGATAGKTSRVISNAMGGVLFVDEAYALANNSDGGISDYGREAIDTLVKAMEDYRGEFCVIFAGYKNEMQRMLSVNPGLKSRIQFTLDFPNYSRSELGEIASLMLKKRAYTIGHQAMNRILDITDVSRKNPDFANAREIRNILDRVIMCQNLRCIDSEDNEIGLVDVNKYIEDSGMKLPESAQNKILTGEEELEMLIGLSSIKRMIKKIKAYAKRNKGEDDFNLHMCFYGNPGTGKTEVARILSRILYDAGVLSEAKLVETDAYGLLSSVVGDTAPKTKKKIDEAMNGVLFIDEAYALTESGGNGNGEEAIAVLLKAMEDKRGRFCVILAGYKNEIKSMISKNPGFESRIQFHLEFPDYTRDELKEITLAFLSKKKYDISPDALNKILDTADYFRSSPSYANARTVRNILDQVLMNQNLRTEDNPNDRTIDLDDVNDYLADEGIGLSKINRPGRKIGF